MASHGVSRPAVAAVKSEQARRQELTEIEKYKSLSELVNKKKAENDLSQDALDLTTKLVSLNPEYYTLWNYRRLILLHLFEQSQEIRGSGSEVTEALPPGQKVVEELITLDLQFLIPLFFKNPKCYWLWNHRGWLLQQAQAQLPTAAALTLWQGELSLVGKMLSLDSRNFHGWGYRRTVVAKLEQLQGVSMVESEFEYTTKVIKASLSNFSAWHYRGTLIPRLLDGRQADGATRRKRLNDEFKFIEQALWTDPYDQSLWGYHQFLILNIVPTVGRQSFVSDLTNSERLDLLEREFKGTRELLEGAEKCKWIYQALLQYSELYLELDAGNRMFTTQDLRHWLDQLKELDTLRTGRWNDLEKKLNL
ncbi:MAG: hypothetical protein Q9165_006453 [Trypethelium subeluteriae]